MQGSFAYVPFWACRAGCSLRVRAYVSFTITQPIGQLGTQSSGLVPPKRYSLARISSGSFPSGAAVFCPSPPLLTVHDGIRISGPPDPLKCLATRQKTTFEYLHGSAPSRDMRTECGRTAGVWKAIPRGPSGYTGGATRETTCPWLRCSRCVLGSEFMAPCRHRASIRVLSLRMVFHLSPEIRIV